MKITTACLQDCEKVYDIVHKTIETVYPKYYPKEVVSFFCEHHTMQRIKEDIENGVVYILYDDRSVVATGSIHENEICRVFVYDEFQGKGYGSKMMSFLEELISKTYTTICLDASLPGSMFYEKRGYKTIAHHVIETHANVKLVYEIMEKECSHQSKGMYDGKIFVAKQNSEYGEVDAQTIFEYHQEGTLLWAQYHGGSIEKGFMIGSVADNGELDFHYQHRNIDQQVRFGKCHSIPVYLEDGRIELHESWTWIPMEEGSGTSIVIEQDTKKGS